MTVNKREERIELTAVDKFSGVIGQAQSQFKGLGASVDTVKNTLIAVGAVMGTGAMLGYAREVLGTVSALKTMQDQTGASAAELSKIQAVAKIGGHEFSGVADAVGKMVMNLKGADEEGQAAGKALEFLGVKAKDSNGRFRDGAVILQEVAKALAQYEDGGNKVALVQDIMGKSGARYLGLLKDIAEEGEVAARVTDEQVEAVDRYEKSVARAKLAVEDAARATVTDWLPAITRIVEQFTEGRKAGLSFFDTFLDLGSKNPFKDIATNVQDLRLELEELIRTRDRYLALGMKGPAVELGGNIARTQGRLRMHQFMQRQEFMGGSADRRAALLAADPLSAAFEFEGYRAARPLTWNTPDKPKAGPKALTENDVRLEALGFSRGFDEEFSGLTKLYQGGKLGLEEYRAAVERLMEKQQFHKDLLAQQAEAVKHLTAAAQVQVEEEERQGEIVAQFNTTMSERIQQMELEAQLVGADTAEREKAVAFRQIELELQRAMVNAAPATIETLNRLAEAEKARLGAAIDAKVARERAHEAATKAAEEWKNEFKRQSESIERLLSDALMRGFEDGKGWARNFADTLKNLFRTLVLEPIIRPIAQAGAGAMLGAFGMPAGAAGVFTPGGGIGGGLGGLGGFNPFGSIGNAIGGLFGATGGAASIAGLGAAGEIAMLTGSGLGSAGVASTGLLSGIGSALPWVGGALAVGSLLGLFDEGGGPKEQEVLWAYGHGVGNNNITSQDPAFYAATAAMTHKLHADYTAEELMQIPAFSARGAAGSDPFALLRQVEQHINSSLAPILQEKQQREASMVTNLTSHGALSQSLRGYVDGMVGSEYLSPEKRLEGMRGLFEGTLSAAMSGDATAAGRLTGVASSYLSAGREMYASGTDFQQLFTDVNRRLIDALDKSGAAQAAAIAEMPESLRRSSEATIAELKALRDDVRKGLEALNTGLRSLGAQAA